MIRLAAYRLLQQSTASRRRLCSLKPVLRISTEAFSTPPDPQSQLPQRETAAPKTVDGDETADVKRRGRETVVGGYEEEQARVLRAALSYVPRLGWSESAMISGARDVGVSPSFVGSFPRSEAALVEFFMDDCLQRLIDGIDSGEDLNNLILSDRLAKLMRMRLEMQVPYISKWPQALSIQSQPKNLPTSLKQRAVLVDEIWHAAGNEGSDIDWYVRRTVLGGIYSISEVYMLTDHSPVSKAETNSAKLPMPFSNRRIPLLWSRLFSILTRFERNNLVRLIALYHCRRSLY